jgi:hypothetical protein
VSKKSWRRCPGGGARERGAERSGRAAGRQRRAARAGRGARGGRRRARRGRQPRGGGPRARGAGRRAADGLVRDRGRAAGGGAGGARRGARPLKSLPLPWALSCDPLRAQLGGMRSLQRVLQRSACLGRRRLHRLGTLCGVHTRKHFCTTTSETLVPGRRLTPTTRADHGRGLAWRCMLRQSARARARAGQRGGPRGGAGLVGRAAGAPGERGGAVALAAVPRGAGGGRGRALPPAQALARAGGPGAPRLAAVGLVLARWSGPPSKYVGLAMHLLCGKPA